MNIGLKPINLESKINARLEKKNIDDLLDSDASYNFIFKTFAQNYGIFVYNLKIPVNYFVL